MMWFSSSCFLLLLSRRTSFECFGTFEDVSGLYRVRILEKIFIGDLVKILCVFCS